VAKLWHISEAGPREALALSSQELRGGVGGVAFSLDGDQVITANYTDVAVKVWDLTIGGNAEWANFPADPAGWPGLSFAPDGLRLVASAGEGSVTAWDLEAAQHVTPASSASASCPTS
jgi:WD40 repeat protein